MNKLDIASEQSQLVMQKEEIIQKQKALLDRRDNEREKQEKTLKEL